MPKRKASTLPGSDLQTTFFHLDDPSSTIVQQALTNDHRRIRQKRIPIVPPSPEKNAKGSVLSEVLSMHDHSDFDWSNDSCIPNWDSEGGDGVGSVDFSTREERAKKATRSSACASKLMTAWLSLAPKFLAEFMHREGRGDCKRGSCCKCSTETEELYRCRSCCGGDLWCSLCITEDHVRRPFDVIEKWNGSFFERWSLAKLGHVIQLGHAVGQQCDNPKRVRTGFVVVDLNGVLDVRINECQCRSVGVIGDLWQQLMRFGLYPATTEDPRTAFTFRTLSLFHTLTLQGKVSLYDFYHALETVTDGTGVVEVKDRYECFIRVMRQWRYLKLLKRGGMGNTPEVPLDDIAPGGLAVACPACPRPGINMPDDWESSTPLSKQFLYHKFISIDACFRLKRRAISSEKKDPGLYSGLAYFVPQIEYQSWMKEVPEQKETNTCSSLAAMEQANTKYSKGYATTGAILCLCARHEIVEPNGTVDTPKGEKFMYSDYAIGCSQRRGHVRLFRILCYDIACQYYKKFFLRMERLPLAARMGLHTDRWKFAVPKLHIQSHERSCQENFALNFILGAGQTDGEGVERHWANLGPIATSTKEMGPGHRRDTIDDHLGWWNWLKITRLGELLFKRRRDARLQRDIHNAELLDFSCGVADSLSKWMECVQKWESGESDENPYSLPRSNNGTAEQETRLKWAEKEEEQEKLGIPALHEVSPSAFITLALDIEEQQRQLRFELDSKEAITPDQKTALIDRRTRLSRALARLRTIQQTYTPLILSYLDSRVAAECNAASEEVQNKLVGLPSLLPESLRKQPSMKQWVEMEIDFRHAQLRASLHYICMHLFVRARLHVERSLQVRYQKDSTRARQSLSRNDDKIRAFKEKFRAAWVALESLVGTECVGYPKLRDEDIRCLDEADTHALKNRRKVLGDERRSEKDKQPPLIRPGESRKVTSWIWKDVDLGDGSDAMQDAVRIEWCKTWARKRRWDEELELIEEEMRRTLESLRYEGQLWCERAKECESSVDAEGRSAYALRQAAIRQELVVKFVRLWAKPDPPPRKRVSLKEAMAEVGSDADEEGLEDESASDLGF
ncbi:hypothetical protein VNI00_017635 [Paramarasmius palmivorus]|uniref:CxC2-like cysteine cluster KDZ transposase-associated domain-containing protein n=1 Tax=Paramarasmius palmivorus TaxID=297713 RepID=A0AAW0B5N2_9AGAR